MLFVFIWQPQLLLEYLINSHYVVHPQNDYRSISLHFMNEKRCFEFCSFNILINHTFHSELIFLIVIILICLLRLAF